MLKPDRFSCFQKIGLKRDPPSFAKRIKTTKARKFARKTRRVFSKTLGFPQRISLGFCINPGVFVEYLLGIK